MTIVFVLKNGYELKMKCKEFSIDKDCLGGIIGYSAMGVTENKPVYIDLSQIMCIYRIRSDEI